MSEEPYDRDPQRFFREYEAIPFEQAHARVLDHLPKTPGMILDVGAGSGRDAAWFAARGHEVLAAEPATGLRDLAADRHESPRIRWVDDRLPSLDRVRASGTRFDLVWVSAVWMHIARSDRASCFRKLANALRPGGRLFISLRHGEFEDDRTAWPVSAGELLDLARRNGLICIAHHDREPDRRGRAGIEWEGLLFELPDDGTGAFPRLRNIILNDDRSSTYKLGLLRSLLRIADGSPGMVEVNDHGDVSVPLGLVALYWIRLYKPLVANGLRQAPARTGYGFVDANFDGLDVPPSLLKPGAAHQGTTATLLRGALRKAAQHIVNMPAHFITDADGRQTFRATYQRQRSASRMRLDAETLTSFGELIVPRALWNAMRQHAVWIEPVIESEWIRTMRGYDERIGKTHREETYRHALAWLSPDHDTREVRSVVAELRAAGKHVNCAWRGTRLPPEFAIDHVIPWIRWPCNDLWNLVPTTTAANSSKGHRLPSADLLAQSEDRFSQWWSQLRHGSGVRAERFEQEIRATLPFVTHPSNAAELFDGVALLRASLRRDQQIPEWNG